MQTPVSNLVHELERLAMAEARNFLVMNLPFLGAIPRYNSDPKLAAAMDDLTVNFNVALEEALNEWEQTWPLVTLHRLDVASLFNQALSDPAAFGLTNVSQSAAPGLQSGDFFYDSRRIVSNPDEYLFWDDLHPTTVAHNILAARALSAVTMVADFDGNGSVDGVDFLLWQLGESPHPQSMSDLNAWKASYGATGGASIPEPATTIFVVVGMAVHVAIRSDNDFRRRRRRR